VLDPEITNALTVSNTVSTDDYRAFCKANELKIHPARMAPELPEFFIRFLTDEDDLVFDPFGGSNTTGAAAEGLGRQWLTLEPQNEYIQGSLGRFPDLQLKKAA
jgi:site-specific DNA-methyltransferase (cytosine-N4-specific)